MKTTSVSSLYLILEACQLTEHRASPNLDTVYALKVAEQTSRTAKRHWILYLSSLWLADDHCCKISESCLVDVSGTTPQLKLLVWYPRTDFVRITVEDNARTSTFVSVTIDGSVRWITSLS